MTDPIHLSLSGILDFRLCQRKYDFAHNKRLRLRGVVSDTMVSGRVVDAALTEILSGATRELPDIVDDLLDKEFDGQLDKINRFSKGCLNAVSKCPADILDHSDWHVQEPAELTISLSVDQQGRVNPPPDYRPVVKQDVVVHMRPDIWRTDPMTGDIILLDFKTTENDPMDYQLWEPQLRYYALSFLDKLTSQYMCENDGCGGEATLDRCWKCGGNNVDYIGEAANPNQTVWFRYVCLPTQGKKVVDLSVWPFTKAAETQARLELQAIVGWMVANHGSTIPTMSRLTCKFCDFNKICTTIVTGGAPKDTIKSDYYVRERRDHA